MLKTSGLIAGATACGQLIAFIGSLVLVRIYTPEAMGIYSTIVAVSTCLAPLISGRLEMALPIVRNDRSAVRLAALSVLGALLISAVVAGSIAFVSLLDSPISNIEPMWWWALPMVSFSLVCFLCGNQLAVRFGSYRSLAIRGVLYPSLMSGAQVLFGLAMFGSSGLIWGLAFGHIVTAATLWAPAIKRTRNPGGSSYSSKQLLRKYKEFPIFLAPSGVINALSVQLPQLGVALLFGMAIAGQFGMMAKILAVPVALVGQSIGYVYAGEIARLKRDGTSTIVRIFDRLAIRLAAVALLMVCFVVTLGEPVFAWLLGEPWRMAGQLAVLYSASTALQLVTAPLSQTLIIAGRTKSQLAVDLVRTLLILATFIIMSNLDASVEATVLAVGLSSAGGYLILWFVNRRAAANIQGSNGG